jgi:ABC-type branched-subunit amino acid transport system ATPase component
MKNELPGDKVINTSGLTKAFDGLMAVTDMHLEVLRGDVFGFLVHSHRR